MVFMALVAMLLPFMSAALVESFINIHLELLSNLKTRSVLFIFMVYLELDLFMI